MKRQRQITPEGPPKVPAYIVTYSDMVTLLLTFFVMLQTLSNVQDPELFYMGRGSFIQSIRELGLGMLYGRKPLPDFGNVKIKYFISTPDKLLQVRTIHAKEEELRRIFEKISRSMTTMPSQIVAEKTIFSLTNIKFSLNETALDESAKSFLTEFCRALQEYPESQAGIGSRFAGALYVLGLTSEQVTEKQQWLLSARRAQVVADFLQSTLGGGWQPQSAKGGLGMVPAISTSHPQDSGEPFGIELRAELLNRVAALEAAMQPAWCIYWWGAGPGGDWVGKDSPISRQSQILIAVLRATD